MTTKEKIAIMQAYEDGKAIQYLYYGVWTDIDVPCWNWAKCQYRVKPEPKLRPYKDAAEFLQAQKEHGMYLTKDGKSYYIPIQVYTCCAGDICVQIFKSDYIVETAVELCNNWKWQDGTPCGIMEE